MVVICGGNIDSRMFASVMSRFLVSFRRGWCVCVFVLWIGLVRCRGSRELFLLCGSNILELHHQRLFSDVPAKEAEVDALIETSDAAHGETIRQGLQEAGYETQIMETTTGSI